MGAAIMDARVKTGLWVGAVLRQAGADGRFGVVLRKGDPDAGGVIVVLRGHAGWVALTQVHIQSGAMAWMRGTGPDPVAQAALDQYLERRRRSDPDLWILEFDSPGLELPFDGRLA